MMPDTSGKTGGLDGTKECINKKPREIGAFCGDKVRCYTLCMSEALGGMPQGPKSLNQSDTDLHLPWGVDTSPEMQNFLKQVGENREKNDRVGLFSAKVSTLMKYVEIIENQGDGELIEMLKKVGDNLYYLLDSLRLSEADKYKIAESFSRAVNKRLVGKLSVEIVFPGTPFTHETMNAPSGGGEAKRVFGWTIRDAKRIVQYTARVSQT